MQMCLSTVVVQLGSVIAFHATDPTIGCFTGVPRLDNVECSLKQKYLDSMSNVPI